MKVLTLGSTGMAGHVISAFLEEQGHEVFRTSRSERNTSRSAAIDVTDFERLGAYIDEIRPDAVINCIGLLQKTSDARPDLAVLVNSYLPHWLERKLADGSARIIHLSTDCVFSGKSGNYNEDDVTDGMTVYDRSKALGELRNNKDLTFRMSIIGPDIDPRGIGLFNWFMAQTGEISGWTKAIWTGVTTIELARAVNEALKTELSGLYHLVPNSSIDKCSLLGLMRSAFERDDITILEVEGVPANKSLINNRSDFDFVVRDYAQQISDLRRWVDEHKGLYPHYFSRVGLS